MGCGSSKETVAKAEVAPAAPVEATWATRTGEQKSSDVQGAEGTKAAGSREAKSHVWVEDADEDEIEIIQEAPAQQRVQQDLGPGSAQLQPMGNSQEAPQEPEPRSQDADQPMVVAPKPLPKQQQAEAAKLAEMRKRFENKRAEEGPQVTGGRAGADEPSSFVGFSLTQQTPQDHGPAIASQPHTFLPGGIEDFEDSPEQPVVGKHQNQHDDVRSLGFDADDEKLMNDILQDVDE